MAAKKINLMSLFQGVTEALASNKDVLNQQDAYNHDHGDNMVLVFDTVARAMKEKAKSPPSEQLAYASELLRQQESGSAQYYAGGLSQAAQQFAGQKVTTDNATQLIQTLLAGGQAAPASPAAGGPEDALGALLSGLGGSAGAPAPGQAGQAPGLDVGELLNAGLSFLSAKQAGATDTNALAGALMSATQDGNTAYRAQSGAVVANALLQALGSMARKR
jgi:hypothetical protein